jgi:hypothetical protein
MVEQILWLFVGLFLQPDLFCAEQWDGVLEDIDWVCV